jgi:hypothetical protein
MMEEVSPAGGKKKGPLKRMSSGVNYFTGQMKFTVMEEDTPGKKKKVQVVNESDEDSLSEDSEEDDTILSEK